MAMSTAPKGLFVLLLVLQALLLGDAHTTSDTCSEPGCISGRTDGHALLQIQRAASHKPTALSLAHLAGASYLNDPLALSSIYMAIARSTPEGSSTRKLLESFRVCRTCKSYKRFGEANDGGYVMCADGMHNNQPEAAYSFGVERHDQWSAEVMEQLNVTDVNQFDCTVDSSDCTGCKFFRKCVVDTKGNFVPGHDQTDSWTLAEVLENTGHSLAPAGSLLLKMDIESSEWNVLSEDSSTELLKKFGQIVIEYHGLNQQEKHDQFLKAVQSIMAAGMQVAHIHGNNYEGMYTVGDYSVPNVLEVTYVQGPADAECMSEQDYNQDLDAPNNPAAMELPMAHLDGSTKTLWSPDGSR